MRFADIHGQDAAVQALRSSLHRESGTVGLAHAYLFAGPKSVGKTSTALAFAAALNCEDPGPDGDSCGNCLSCIRIEAGTDLDVRVICPEKNQTLIKQTGDMVANLVYAPVNGKRRVYIIEQADTLNTHAENSILKALEEPPDYAIIILLSRNPSSLLQTIRSRCRLVRFHTTSASEIEAVLRLRCDLPDEQIRIIAASAEGAVGRAIGMAEDPRTMEDRRAALEAVRWWAESPPIATLRAAEMLRKIAEPSKSEKEEGLTSARRLQVLLDHVQSWYADMLSIAVRGDSAVLCNVDFADALADHAAMYSRKRISSGIEGIMRTRRYLEGNITAQLALENMLFGLRPDQRSRA
ncbi:MAG: DNA polymerase III subunit delta' [Armatimonadetes bacterium]|nr:DNA polymerase III subunit delta' [Armatimonadota bacterium]